MNAKRYALALPLVLLAGCSMFGSTNERPNVAPPAGWTNGSAAQPPATDIASDWWRSFGADELGALIARAHEGNPDLAASLHRIARATAQARAAGADLYPAIDSSGGGSRRWPGEGRPSNGFQGGLDASYEIDLWGANRARLDSAEALTLATTYDRDTAALSLSAEVSTTFFQYLSLNDRLENARRILDIAERVLALVTRQQELGAASGLEIAQQRGTVASLRATIPTLEQRRAETLNALAELLGTTPGTVDIRTASLDVLELPTIAPGLPSDLLRRRPDIRSAEADLVAAKADVEAARAALMPSIRLTGGSGFSSAELSSLFSPAGFLANLASGIAAPVFDGGRLRAQRDQAIAGEAETWEAYRGAIIAAFRDVEDALAAVEHLAEIESAQRDAFAEAERAYELAEIRYRAGATDFLTLLDAQRNLFQQEDSLEQTRLARLNAAVALYRALGGGWCAENCEP